MRSHPSAAPAALAAAPFASRLAFAGLLAAAGAGCGLAGGAPSSSTTDPAVRAVTADVLPRFRTDEQLRLCLGAAASAAQLSGSSAPAVTHGTVDASGQTVTYDDAPADALVLIRPEGTTRYDVVRAVYDPAAGAQDVFVRDHDVECHAVRAGAFDFTVSSKSSGGDDERHASGTVDDGHDAYDVALDETGHETTTFDGGAVTYDGTAERTISVTGAGLEATSHERDADKVVIFQNAVENRNTTVDIDATVDGAAFAMKDALIKRSFTDGIPQEPDFWGETAGTLTKDGADVATLAFEPNTAGFEIVLRQDNGDTVLEQWAF